MDPDRGGNRAYIERSRQRSAGYGVEPDRLYPRRILEGAELAERLAQRRDLVVAAEPFLARLHSFLRGSAFFALLTDGEGCILSVLGDEAMLEEAFSLRMVPGAFMDEASIGTNAMGTALAEGQPVQVSGSEHSVSAYHRWSCSAAPIKDSQGQIIGCLDLTGRRDALHLHTLGMVVAAVGAIENTLFLNARNEALSEQRRFTETLLDSIKEGIVSVRLDGDILSVNAQALEMFGYSREELLGLGIEGLLPCWRDLRAACLEGREYANEDAAVTVRTNRLYFNLGTYPIQGRDGRPEAIILLFKDVKKGRKHANEIMGRRALYTFDKIIGTSPAIRAAIDFSKKVADSRSTILISGESGTGKEIFAQAIQNASPRRDEAFVVLNCGAISPNLIESELFGYTEGAFTGAKRGGHPGKFEIADKGTIFLDEIGEMPLEMQIRLLRVIEEGTVMRVGDSREIPVDVRVIAATNKELRSEVQAGRFRMDLFYRLNVLPIRIPPLRERPDDIPLLVEYYMRKASRKLNKKPVELPPGYIDRLCGLEWSGNIRELENHIEFLIMSEGLPSEGTPPALSAVAPPLSVASAPSLEAAEQTLIRATLLECGNNVSQAARRLGIGRNTLYRKIQRYKIDCSIMVQ